MLDPAVFLCYQKDFLVALHRFIECKDGFLARHIKVEHHFWKHDQTTDRDRWQAQGLHFGHLNLFLGLLSPFFFRGKTFSQKSFSLSIYLQIINLSVTDATSPYGLSAYLF